MRAVTRVYTVFSPCHSHTHLHSTCFRYQARGSTSPTTCRHCPGCSLSNSVSRPSAPLGVFLMSYSAMRDHSSGQVGKNVLFCYLEAWNVGVVCSSPDMQFVIRISVCSPLVVSPWWYHTGSCEHVNA